MEEVNDAMKAISISLEIIKREKITEFEFQQCIKGLEYALEKLSKCST